MIFLMLHSLLAPSSLSLTTITFGSFLARDRQEVIILGSYGFPGFHQRISRQNETFKMFFVDHTNRLIYYTSKWFYTVFSN